MSGRFWKQWNFKKVSKFCCSNVGCECMLLLVLPGGSQALNELKQKLQDLRVRSWDMTSNCNLQGFSNWIGDLFDFVVLIDCLLLAYWFVSMLPSMAHDYVFARATLAYWLFRLWCKVHLEIFNRETSTNCHEFIKSPDLRNMQPTFDCTQTNTCQVRATRVKASVVETEASNHPQNPLRSLVSSIFQPANPWSQSSPCVFQQICIVSSRAFLRHKWRTATWNTKWPRLELFRRNDRGIFLYQKRTKAKNRHDRQLEARNILGFGFFSCVVCLLQRDA